jgi:hypothetical protein
MELKTLAADNDLFNAMKKLTRKTKQQETRNVKAYRKASAAIRHEHSVFGFINRNLVEKKS